MILSDFIDHALKLADHISATPLKAHPESVKWFSGPNAR
ncbi:hypothetical protein CES85_2083 [Ochrobactrum quorumnocens]|uniref:Uncharacterized protein n=1 Tax=Ochrobactrum quorumnocens TaxID=271865 RepID=A0A248UGQ5_9HYPH|nr:hypothetical protein CES85_2083 [[Ochrobactrum] quorumnocens]